MALHMGGLPDPALRLVGSISVAFGQLEESLTDLVALATAPTRHRLAVTALIHHDSFSAKLDKLRLLSSTEGRLNERRVDWVLTDNVPHEVLAQLRDLVGYLEEASRRRNAVVHSSWYHRTVEGEPVLLRRTEEFRRRGPRRVSETWTMRDLEGVLNAVKAALSACGVAFGDLYRATHPTGTEDES